MTANEMRNLAKELYDGASSVEMGYDDREVSRFLNVAVKLELDKRIFANRNQVQEGVEIGSKRGLELTELKKKVSVYKLPDGSYQQELETITNVGFIGKDSFDNGCIVNLPSDFMYHLRDNADIKYKNKIYRVKIESVNEDNLEEELTNTYKRPTKYKALRTSMAKGILPDSYRLKLYIVDGAELYKYNLVYIRKPIDIVVDILTPINQVNCDIDEALHIAIVKTAVQIMLGSIGSNKYQIAVNENMNNN